jgi:hypothetical protein
MGRGYNVPGAGLSARKHVVIVKTLVPLNALTFDFLNALSCVSDRVAVLQ